MRVLIRAALIVLAVTPSQLVAQKVGVQPEEAPAVHDHWHGDDDGDGNGLRLGLSVASSYNRVEGLPVMFGPVVRAGEANRLELSGQVIWRTDPSASLRDEVGYRVRVDQGLFGGGLRVGGEAISWVRPIETHGMSATEPGLSALLFHNDLQDYHEERAWGVYAELRAADPLTARLGFRRADHSPVEVSDPWTLFRDEDRWRAQPLVAEGRASLLSLRLTLDTRGDDAEARQGVYASFEIERALDQDLAMPLVDFGGAPAGGRTFDDFTLASIDLRRHQPVTDESTLSLRLFAAGAIEEMMLPPQHQRALGGRGTLPGFALFDGACGSRDVAVARVSDDGDVAEQTMLAGYGCDRVLLGQLEYRGDFGGAGEEDRTDGVHYHGPWRFKGEMPRAQWVLLVDAARGWALGDADFGARFDTETMVDAGLGLVFGEAGVYAAVPLTGDDRELRIVVRLQPRF